MSDINITEAKYALDLEGNNINIKAVVDGVEMIVPLDPANRHYAAILQAVDDGDLVIADADQVQDQPAKKTTSGSLKKAPKE